MGDWHPYDVFNMPPPHVLLEVEVDVMYEYDGGQTKKEKRVLRSYYDTGTGMFRWPGMWPSALPGEVLRWRLIDENNVS